MESERKHVSLDKMMQDLAIRNPTSFTNNDKPFYHHEFNNILCTIVNYTHLSVRIARLIGSYINSYDVEWWSGMLKAEKWKPHPATLDPLPRLLCQTCKTCAIDPRKQKHLIMLKLDQGLVCQKCFQELINRCEDVLKSSIPLILKPEGVRLLLDYSINTQDFSYVIPTHYLFLCKSSHYLFLEPTPTFELPDMRPLTLDPETLPGAIIMYKKWCSYVLESVEEVFGFQYGLACMNHWLPIHILPILRPSFREMMVIHVRKNSSLFGHLALVTHTTGSKKRSPVSLILPQRHFKAFPQVVAFEDSEHLYLIDESRWYEPSISCTEFMRRGMVLDQFGLTHRLKLEKLERDPKKFTAYVLEQAFNIGRYGTAIQSGSAKQLKQKPLQSWILEALAMMHNEMCQVFLSGIRQLCKYPIKLSC